MEQPNNIDQLFQQRLQQTAVPPPDFVWPNVERALRRRKRRFFLWFFTAGLASVGLWALWQTTPAGQGADKPSNTSAVFREPIAAQNTAPQHSDTKPAIAPPPTISNLSKPENTEQFTSPVAGFNTSNQKAKQNTTPRGGATTVSGISDNDFAPGYFPKSAATVDDLLPGSISAPEATTGFNFSTIAPQLPVEPALLTLPSRVSGVSPLALPPIKKKSPKKCYDFHSNRQAWLLDVYTGPSFVRKRLDTSNPEFKEYVQDRFATEKRDWAFHAGARASYLFAENFIVRTGLHYEQFVEQFEYIDPNFIQYNISVTQKYINGEWVTVMDTTDVQYGANYVKTYNRFSLLDIPLQAALELRSGPTGVSLNLGGSVNVLFRQRGSILTMDGKPADLNDFQIFRPKVGLSLLGSIQWFYHLTPRLRVFAEPYYRHILEPVTQAGYPVEQSYGIGGVRLGLTKIFD